MRKKQGRKRSEPSNIAPLTDLQRQYLAFYRAVKRDTKRPPSLTQYAAHFGVFKATAQVMVRCLAAKGHRLDRLPTGRPKVTA